jgi:hypothetical protein
MAENNPPNPEPPEPETKPEEKPRTDLQPPQFIYITEGWEFDKPRKKE